MKLIYCVVCQKKHTSPWGWKYKKWYTKLGVVEGWGCNKHPTEHHEFTTDSIREQRKEYKKELLQPYRQGEFSKEYKEAYPEISCGMVKEGAISRTQFEKARDVWK